MQRQIQKEDKFLMSERQKEILEKKQGKSYETIMKDYNTFKTKDKPLFIDKTTSIDDKNIK